MAIDRQRRGARLGGRARPRSTPTTTCSAHAASPARPSSLSSTALRSRRHGPAAQGSTRGVSLRLPTARSGSRATWAPTPDGRSTLEDGTVFSRNSVTAQLIGEVGADKVATLAQRLGVREKPARTVPSLALGTSPVSLLRWRRLRQHRRAGRIPRAAAGDAGERRANSKPLMAARAGARHAGRTP